MRVARTGGATAKQGRLRTSARAAARTPSRSEWPRFALMVLPASYEIDEHGKCNCKDPSTHESVSELPLSHPTGETAVSVDPQFYSAIRIDSFSVTE